MKILGATRVFQVSSGQPVETFQIDISSLNFQVCPYAICQLVHVGTNIEFCYADWNGSTNTTLHAALRRYDGGNLTGGNRRVNIILLGNQGAIITLYTKFKQE